MVKLDGVKNRNDINDLFDNINIGILYLDVHRNIHNANNEMTNILGYSTEELIGMNGKDLSFPEDDKDSAMKIAKALAQKQLKVEVVKRYIHKQGHIVYCELFVNLNQIHNIFVVFVKDVTERIEQKRKLEALSKELKEANKAKDQFFSIIGHDLLNPVGGIQSLTRILVNNFDNYSNDEVKHINRSILDGSTHILDLLKNLLLWSRAQSNQLKIKPQIVNLRSLVTKQIKIYQNSADLKQIVINNNIRNSIFIYSDYFSLATVFRNLISNAIKFTHKHGEISINCNYTDKKKCNIEVSDTGIGIQKEKLPYIFDVENKFTSTGTNYEKGTGLGLKLCKEFVMKNGGKISVKSEVDKGTTFTIELDQLSKKEFEYSL